MYRIAQISDIHISPDSLCRFEVDTRERFVNVIKNIEGCHPDLIVITGDLAYKYSEKESYLWLKDFLREKSLNIIFIPGNHDSPKLISGIFSLGNDFKNGEIYFELQVEGFVLLFLDTSTEILTEKQLKYIKEADRISCEKSLILFVHHPLFLCDCKFMDASYPLRNIPEVEEVLFSCRNIKAIFSGHYHSEIEKVFRNIIQYIAPATVFQLPPEFDYFHPDISMYGWREIVLSGNKLKSVVHYL